MWFSKQKLSGKILIGCLGLFILFCLCGFPIAFFSRATSTPQKAASPPVDVSNNQTEAVRTGIEVNNQTATTNILTQTLPPTITFTPSSTSTSTPLPPDVLTQTAMVVQATSTHQAYEIMLTATAIARPSDLTFLEIENNYYNLDDNDWNSYRASLKGLRVQWSGMLLHSDVADTLQLYMGQYALNRMITLHIPPTITINKLNEGDTIIFIAEILDVTFFCDVQLILLEMK